MTSARLIANPASGKDRAAELLPAINARLRTIVDRLDITITTDAADLERVVARTIDDEVDALYVIGGDGTINLVLHALMQVPGAATRLPVGIIPGGTGNDFAKSLDLGEDPDQALERLLERRVVDVDLGLLNERPFANTSAGGFMAEVSAAVDEELKDVAGKIAYLIGGVQVFLSTEPFYARLAIHDVMTEMSSALGDPLEAQMFVACNGRFIGGGHPLAPSALLDDGLLDVVVVPGMSGIELAAVLQRMRSGQHAGDHRLLHFRASAFDLDIDRAVRVNTDGEVLQANRCRYRVLPRAARFFCGPAPHTVRPAAPFSAPRGRLQ